jgi:hypothetical protein
MNTTVRLDQMSSSGFLNIKASTATPPVKKRRPKAPEPTVLPQPADPDSESTSCSA